MSADLLGAGLLLGLEGGEFNKQGAAGHGDQAGAALPGRGEHLPGTTGAMGGDCIRGCTSIWPLSPTPWPGSPLALQIQGQQPSPTPLEGNRHEQWQTLPCGWGIPVSSYHPPSFCRFWLPVSFRVWVDPVCCLCLSPALWPRGPQRGAWTYLSLRLRVHL